MPVTGAQAFLEALLAEGAEVAFGIPGTHILPIIELLEEDRQLKFVNVRHEAGAAAMADAYGRLTRAPGVCLVTAGPGATNSVTGVAHAFSAASPLFHASGTVPTNSGQGAFHGADKPGFLEKVFAPVTKVSGSVRSVSEIPETVHRFFRVASTGRRGPVHLSLPLNVLLAHGHYKSAREVTRKNSSAKARLSAAKKVIASSHKPLILLGEEVRGLRHEVELCAQKIAGPVLSTMNAFGVFPQTNPLFAGYIEQFWRIHPAALDLLQETDLLILIGVRLGTPEVKCVSSVCNCNWLSITEDAHPARSTKRNIMHIRGDIRSNLSFLARVMPTPSESRSHWGGRAASHMQHYVKELEEIASKNRETEPIHPALAVEKLVPYLPEGGVVCTDSGSNEVWVREYLGMRRKCDYLYSGTFGGMGFALPAAVAASIVRPEVRALAIAGDGGLLMSLMELSTLAENKSNAVAVVLNDSAYGMIWLLQHHKIASVLHPVDFAKVAEGFGIRSWRVEELRELEGVYAEAFSTQGPALVDVIVDYKHHFPYESTLEEFRRKYPDL